VTTEKGINSFEEDRH